MGTLRIGVPGLHPSTATLEALVARHGNHVYQVAFHLTGSTSDAEDIVQTVFLKLYNHWAYVSRVSNLPGWINRVATNVCIDLLRKKKVRGPSVENSTLDRTLAGGRSPAREVENKELAEKLQEAMSTLPRRQLAALVLFDHEGLKGREIARILDVTETAVRSYVHEARRRLREILTPYLRGSDS